MTTLSTIHRREQRELGLGDRIHFTRLDEERGIRRGDLGTTVQVGAHNGFTVRLDNGRTVEISADQAKYIEQGYAVERLKSFRAQRVLVSISGPSEVAAKSALATAITRSSASTTIYISDGASLAEHQAAERARVTNTGQLVIDQSIHAIPTAGKIATLFPLVATKNQSYSQERKPINQKAALRCATPQAQSPSEYDNCVAIGR